MFTLLSVSPFCSISLCKIYLISRNSKDWENKNVNDHIKRTLLLYHKLYDIRNSIYFIWIFLILIYLHLIPGVLYGRRVHLEGLSGSVNFHMLHRNSWTILREFTIFQVLRRKQWKHEIICKTVLFLWQRIDNLMDHYNIFHVYCLIVIRT